MTVSVSEFKARCLSLLDQVHKGGQEIVVTKRGCPVARVVPMPDQVPPGFFGLLRGSVVVVDDLLKPIGEDWDADV